MPVPDAEEKAAVPATAVGDGGSCPARRLRRRYPTPLTPVPSVTDPPTPDALPAGLRRALAARAAHISRTVASADPVRLLAAEADEPVAHDVRIDAGLLLAATPGVQLRPEASLRVAARVHRRNDNGVVYAEFPGSHRPAAADILGLFDGRLRDLPTPAAALTLDGTLQTYFDMSVLLRALGDIGSRGHGGSWWACRVIDQAMFESGMNDSRFGRLVDECWTDTRTRRYATPRRMELDPDVRRDGADVVVRFTVVSALGTMRMWRVRDRYVGGAAAPTSEREWEMEGGRGILT